MVWVATIRIRGDRIPLIEFNPRQLGRGMSWRTDKKKGRVRERAAFLATVKTETGGEHVGVFVRRGSGDDRVPRLPIQQLLGPSVPFVMGRLSELARSVLGEAIVGRLEKEVDTQSRLVLDRKGRA